MSVYSWCRPHEVLSCKPSRRSDSFSIAFLTTPAWRTSSITSMSFKPSSADAPMPLPATSSRTLKWPKNSAGNGRSEIRSSLGEECAVGPRRRDCLHCRGLAGGGWAGPSACPRDGGRPVDVSPTRPSCSRGRDELFNPALQALNNLGGSASIPELVDEVARIVGLSEADLAEETSQGESRFAYRLAWARSYLKGFGLLDNSERGVWSLTNRGRETSSVDPDEVKRFVRSRRRVPEPDPGTEAVGVVPPTELVAGSGWQEELLEVLLALEPNQFERLCQRILRESGFTQVEVTGRSGDGGIDGTGTVQLGGLLSFPILFQCKRHQGSVGSGVVRDFRGAMVGRADRGLILTTGIFTRDAKVEARRDGAPPIDLVDRERLLDKLRELRLGVSVERIERVAVDREWFRQV